MSDAMLYLAVWVENWKASVREALEDGERGQGMVEYGLILGLVSIAAIAIMVLLGGQIGARFTEIRLALGGA
jgi:Flp pilus assembly pilin Flp